MANYFMDGCVSKGINRINDCLVKGELTEIGQDERGRTF